MRLLFLLVLLGALATVAVWGIRYALTPPHLRGLTRAERQHYLSREARRIDRRAEDTEIDRALTWSPDPTPREDPRP